MCLNSSASKCTAKCTAKAKMYRGKTNKTTTIVNNFNILQKTVEKINENVDFSKMIMKQPN